MKKPLVPTAYVLLNSDLGSNESIINEVKQILTEEDIKFEVQGVYGVYDIVLKLTMMLKNYVQSLLTKLEKSVKFNPR